MWSMQKVYKGWWPDPPWKQVQSLITPAGCPIQGDHLTLEADHEFLMKGGVFTPEWLEGYLEVKWAEVQALRVTTHPVEYQMYYSL